jgi:hypothetical protein
MGLGTTGSASLQFYTNSTERARIDSSGRLLVGTSTARSVFDADVGTPRVQQEGASFGSAGLLLFSDDNTATASNYLAFGRARGGSLGSTTIVNSGDTLGFVSFCGADGTGFNRQAARIDAFVDGTPGSGDMPGRLVFSTTADGSSSPTERMRIDSSGKVGISTTSPTELLNVNGNFALDTGVLNTPKYIKFNANSTSAIYGGIEWYNYQWDSTVRASITSGIDGGVANGYLAFSTGSGGVTERMRITYSGIVGIGTSAPYTGTTCDTYNNSASQFIQTFRQDNSSGYGIGIGSDSSALIYFYPNKDLSGAPVGTISQNGSSTTYATSSDYRLKENVVPLTGSIERINDLQVHRFNFIADPNTTVDGFIAHEVQAIVPESVTGEKDAVDADGNPIYQGIDQSKLVPLLTAALQEALQKIDAMEARLSALENG